jgi:hypothetical protein
MIADTLPNGFRSQQVLGSMDVLLKRSLLLADQPGTGKTLQALLALELDGAFTGKRPYSALIMTNTTGCQLTWAGELRRRILSQYPDVVICDLTDTRGKKTMPSLAVRNDRVAQAMMQARDTGAALVVLTNFEALRIVAGQQPKVSHLFDITFDAVVIDESQLVLPTTEDGTGKVSQFWRGLMRLRIAERAIRLDMSGTPDRGKLENRYGHWKFLHPRSHTNYWGWVAAHFFTWREVVGEKRLPNGQRQKIEATIIGGLKNPAAWVEYEHQHMLRRTKKEMLKGLPEKQWASDGAVELDLTPAQLRQHADFRADLDARKLEYIAADEPGKASALELQWPMRSRQIATCTWNFEITEDANGEPHMHGTPLVAGPESSNKLAWLLNWMQERGYVRGQDFDVTGGKVVIVSFFTEVLEWLKLELAAANIEAEVMSGDTPAPQKLAIEERFQRGDLRVILLSGYLGVSINLDAADDMIFADPNHDPDRMEQAEDRIHRASRDHQVMYWRLCSLGTSDPDVIAAIDDRYRTTRTIYDGSRGVTHARAGIRR